MDQDQSGTITLMELYKFIMRVSKIDNPEVTEVGTFRNILDKL